MLTCRQITELVTSYVEGDMPREQRLDFLRHLKGCRVCFHYLRQVRATKRALGRAPTAPPPPEVRAALLAQFRAWKPGGPKDGPS
jgi:anti-sigma factor RsiW